MPNFCPNCGKDITEKVKFCPECGADISSFLKKPDEIKNFEETKSEIKTENETPDKRKPKNKNILKNILIYSCIVIAIIVLLLIVFTFGTSIMADLHPNPSTSVTNQVSYTPTYVVPTLTTTRVPTVTLTSTPAPVNLYKACIEKYAGTQYDPYTECENVPNPNIQYVSTTPTTQYVYPVRTTPTISPYNSEAVAVSKAIDYLNPTVKNFANQKIQHSSGGTYNIAQICDIWQSLFNQWTYVSDPPNFDYWTSASDSITNGLKGNCADYAVLNAAVIESIGGSARVITTCAPGGSPCHAYAEVGLANSQSGLQTASNYICSRYHCNAINTHSSTDAQGNTEYWLNLDWQANYPGGPFFQDDGTLQIFYPNGNYITITG
jgi:hypothetical protein